MNHDRLVGHVERVALDLERVRVGIVPAPVRHRRDTEVKRLLRTGRRERLHEDGSVENGTFADADETVLARVGRLRRALRLGRPSKPVNVLEMGEAGLDARDGHADRHCIATKEQDGVPSGTGVIQRLEPGGVDGVDTPTTGALSSDGGGQGQNKTERSGQGQCGSLPRVPPIDSRRRGEPPAPRGPCLDSQLVNRRRPPESRGAETTKWSSKPAHDLVFRVGLRWPRRVVERRSPAPTWAAPRHVGARGRRPHRPSGS